MKYILQICQIKSFLLSLQSDLFCFKRFFYLLMNVLIILKTIFVYIKYLFYLKGFGTECAP